MTEHIVTATIKTIKDMSDDKPLITIANKTGDAVLYKKVGIGFEIVNVQYGKYKEEVNK